jgi:hypothetical protein
MKWRLVGSGGVAPPFLASLLDGGQWSAWPYGAFYPHREIFRYVLDRSLSGPHSWSGRYREEKNLLPCQESKPEDPTRSHAIWTILTM